MTFNFMAFCSFWAGWSYPLITPYISIANQIHYLETFYRQSFHLPPNYHDEAHRTSFHFKVKQKHYECVVTKIQ